MEYLMLIFLVLAACVVAGFFFTWALDREMCDVQINFHEFVKLYEKDSTCWNLESTYVIFSNGWRYIVAFSFLDHLLYLKWKIKAIDDELRTQEKMIREDFEEKIRRKYGDLK